MYCHKIFLPGIWTVTGLLSAYILQTFTIIGTLMLIYYIPIIMDKTEWMKAQSGSGTGVCFRGNKITTFNLLDYPTQSLIHFPSLVLHYPALKTCISPCSATSPSYPSWASPASVLGHPLTFIFMHICDLQDLHSLVRSPLQPTFPRLLHLFRNSVGTSSSFQKKLSPVFPSKQSTCRSTMHN